MATTDNLGLTLPASGASGYDSSVNGNFTDLDEYVYRALNPMVWDENTNGRIDSSTEIMTFDGDVLFWD